MFLNAVKTCGMHVLVVENSNNFHVSMDSEEISIY